MISPSLTGDAAEHGITVAGVNFSPDDIAVMALGLAISVLTFGFIWFLQRLDEKSRHTAVGGSFLNDTVLGTALLYLLPMLVSGGMAYTLYRMEFFGSWWWMLGGFSGFIAHLLFSFRRSIGGVVLALLGKLFRTRFGVELPTEPTDSASTTSATPAPVAAALPSSTQPPAQATAPTSTAPPVPTEPEPAAPAAPQKPKRKRR